MTRFARILVVFAAVFSASAALAAHTHVPANSTWTLDVKASDFGGGPTMKSDVIVALTDTEKWLKYTDVTVDEQGKTWKTSWSGPEDGTLKPITGMPGGTFSVKAADDTQVMTLPDGTRFVAVYSVSSDGKTMTFAQTATTKDGKTFKQKLVYKRTK